MIITTTSISFSLLSVGLGFFGWKFYKAFQNPATQTKNKTGLLIGSSFLASALDNGILGIGALLFGKNPNILYAVFLISYIFLILFAINSIFTLNYIFFPDGKLFIQIASIILISTTGFIGLFLNNKKPFITDQNGIDWNLNFLSSICIWSLLFIGISSLLYIFLQLFKKTKILEIKILSLIIIMSSIFGIINTFIRLIVLFKNTTAIRTEVFDIGIGIIGILFFVIFSIPFIKKQRKTN